ncbi:2-amino-4-hydroxy-6-hydroxymethyldihydropteridine diphosphokinase [Gramella sp. AN32]|uniref:2-amino-4-hydroxy-6-hydroxymethyldihydropteridine pyrophosphokinase n=1 Tax=Christiangramia antarctica TaxID=2058158 RepID=A0ABW5X8Z3_9FLAO|nr:2-amino-4-hydroxy-6-hydroxymethyldihydropteridine diphosphokinase [Gramella sp. AN32]MCM4155258.1 2-amino-4-hydroxy-6-hydroxymethyldihydropteridine diphosphokinase [Gramella sp. AN32]
MDLPKTVTIALGSNLGNRLQFMNIALRRIHEEIGWVRELSGVYETPAWGFEGNTFLNACILVSTRLSPDLVLKNLLKIETELKRDRGDKSAYQNRTIDLDILLFEEEIITSEKLTIPHPGISTRNFVLFPLRDIAANEIHPILKKRISELLKESSDNSKVELTRLKLEKPIQTYSFPQRNYIAVEGNIGAGKTSFSTMISQDFNAKLILERFKDNPFLPKFYENKERYAFPLEMSFLADRYQQLSDDLAQYDLFRDFVISDYDVFKSLIFAQITLQKEEYSLYHKLFHLMYKELVKPELYIYLYQSTDRLLENIKKRGRDYEQNIQAEYLSKINQSYLNFIKTQKNMQVKIVDISGMDFVNNRHDYLQLLDKINQ